MAKVASARKLPRSAKFIPRPRCQLTASRTSTSPFATEPVSLLLMIQALQNWYASNCDGDWEHSFGIRIETLDNPGWLVTIDLEDTRLEQASLTHDFDHSDTDWAR